MRRENPHEATVVRIPPYALTHQKSCRNFLQMIWRCCVGSAAQERLQKKFTASANNTKNREKKKYIARWCAGQMGLLYDTMKACYETCPFAQNIAFVKLILFSFLSMNILEQKPQSPAGQRFAHRTHSSIFKPPVLPRTLWITFWPVDTTIKSCGNTSLWVSNLSNPSSLQV